MCNLNSSKGKQYLPVKEFRIAKFTFVTVPAVLCFVGACSCASYP